MGEDKEKKEVAPDENTEFKVVKRYTVRPLTMAFFLLLVSVYTYLMFGLLNVKNVMYTANDVSYALEASTAVFDVEVKDIRKEKGKEDLYTVRFINIDDRSIRFDRKLEAPDFERIVGEGNNTVSSKMYTLTYVLPNKKKLGSEAYYYVLKLRRVAKLDQVPYSVGEVNLFAEVVVQFAKDSLTKDVLVLNSGYVTELTNSESVELLGLSKGAKLPELSKLPTPEGSEVTQDDPAIVTPDGERLTPETPNTEAEKEETWYNKLIKWLLRSMVVAINTTV